VPGICYLLLSIYPIRLGGQHGGNNAMFKVGDEVEVVRLLARESDPNPKHYALYTNWIGRRGTVLQIEGTPPVMYGLKLEQLEGDEPYDDLLWMQEEELKMI
jgi:hypothetical protein